MRAMIAFGTRWDVGLVVALVLMGGLGSTGVEAAEECGDACAHAEIEEEAHHEAHDAHGEAAGHEDHAEHNKDENDHAGHDHAAHAPEEEGVRLTAAQVERFGIVIETAGPGSLRNAVRLPGEVVFNADRVVHVVPRVAGIAREVKRGVGDEVKAGDVLAVIDSTELAEAKLAYFAAATEVSCCQFELPRAQRIHDNTLKMLELLDTSPGLDQLHGAVAGEMGEVRSRLIKAYAEYVLTKKAYKREKALMAKQISSEGDFLEAENAFKKAYAQYLGTRDVVAYEVRQNLLEAEREQQLAEFESRTAEQRLRMLGLSEAEVMGLGSAPNKRNTHAAGGHVCSDANCKSCQAPKTPAPLVTHDGLGMYALKVPFNGVIVQKHLTLGERVGEDSEVFTIVDMSDVWVNLTVYAKDLALVHKGQDVVVRAEHSGAQARGTVAMVTPFVEETTRTATARVVLDNSDGRWVAGTFVSGVINLTEANLPVVVPLDAVQSIEGEDVVFVEHEGAFEIRPVTCGQADRERVEVLAGLAPGMRYVAKGAFQLKATVITSDLDPHAGHGH